MKINFKNRFLLLAVSPLLLLTFTATSPAVRQFASTSAPARSVFENVHITGTTSTGGQFDGTMDIVSFTQDSNNQLLANGLLTGVLRDASGHQVGSVTNQYVSVPAQLTTSSAGAANVPQPPTTCPILHLTLGPLDLNLLGLTVHLNRVVLDITAVQGPGNLLGNLLCAIAHLLDGGPLSQVVGLLNRVIDLAGR